MKKKIQQYKNLIISGIPRSGTTLVASLINNMNGGICLSEPNNHVKWIAISKNRQDYTDRIEKDFFNIRDRIQRREKIYNRVKKDGSVITNYFNERGKRRYVLRPIDYKDIFNGELVEEEIILGFKHNAHYTSVLPELVERHIGIILIIRNPISTLLSWRRLNLPISKGRLPAGERFWPKLKEISLSSKNLLTKQTKIYNEFCRVYFEYEKLDNVLLVKYEDVLKNKDILYDVFKREKIKNINIKDMNNNPNYKLNEINLIKHSVEKYAPHSFRYYSLNQIIDKYFK